MESKKLLTTLTDVYDWATEQHVGKFDYEIALDIAAAMRVYNAWCLAEKERCTGKPLQPKQHIGKWPIRTTLNLRDAERGKEHFDDERP